MPDTAIDPNDHALPMMPTAEFDEFIYVLSHDLRASIRALVEVPQWIEEDLESEGKGVSHDVQDNLSLMGTHAHRLDQMLLDLLTYSRIGRMQEITDIRMAAAVDQAVTETAVPAGFRVVNQCQDEMLHIGERDIATLIKAFLSNAIKHHDTAAGQFIIRSKRDNTSLILTMEDDGPGIPQNSRARVFDVMTTLRPRDEVEGSGMGLAVAKKIISHYGGQLRWGKLPTERGTQFEITLPLRPAKETA